MFPFRVITQFPEIFSKFSDAGLVGRAINQGHISLDPIQLRDFSINKQRQIDDTPMGGGSGMILRPDVAIPAILDAKRELPNAKVIVPTPRGQVFTQQKANELASNKGGLIILCPRYEGIDQRVLENWVDEEICIGDYILMGGEVPAMVLIESVSRLLPNVLGNELSTVEESFSQAFLEHPQYTKPREHNGVQVPEVLLSGDHQKVQNWRKEKSISDTIERRPDMVKDLPDERPPLALGLIHHPVNDKHGDVVTTSITNLDLHDIARSARTYEVNHFYVAHPVKTLRRLASKICEHWSVGYGATYNPNRSQALERISIVTDLDDIIHDLETRYDKRPKIITTSARHSPDSTTFEQLRATISTAENNQPFLMLFGTGWGMTEEIISIADYHLVPIDGAGSYNHLSVRSAAAIILDRLLGRSNS